MQTNDVLTQNVHSFNVGSSDYSKHNIQPWDIWEEYDLNPWEADIVKRILRNKGNRIEDLQKIIHICRKLIELEVKKNFPKFTIEQDIPDSNMPSIKSLTEDDSVNAADAKAIEEDDSVCSSLKNFKYE